MDSGALWDRVRASSTSGASHLLLAPEDQLLHLCVHFYNDRRLARSGGLLHLCDIALFLERKSGEVDWDEFADRVLRHCPGNAVYTSLYCAAAIGGASPPEAVLDALRPRGFDDSRARLFMARRVIGTSQRVSKGLTLALAQVGARRKVQSLARTAFPPVRWVHAGDTNWSKGRGGPIKFLLRPFRAMAAFGRLLLNLPELAGEVVVERWLTNESAIDVSGEESARSR